MPALASVRYTHDAIIDEILANPSVPQWQLSAMFGYSQGWMSIIINSDAFKERLAERKGELLDPKIQASVDERRDAVAKIALDKLLEELERPGPKKIQDLVSAAKVGIGEGTKSPIQNNLYVVNLPPSATSTGEWLHNAQGRKPPPPDIIDISHINPEP